MSACVGSVRSKFLSTDYTDYAEEEEEKGALSSNDDVFIPALLFLSTAQVPGFLVGVICVIGGYPCREYLR
jgi:hypothetical protein